MLGHLLKNICEPYVICNKKRKSRWRVPNYLKMYETPFGCDITVIALRKAISTGFESSFFSTRSDIQQKWEKMKSETI